MTTTRASRILLASAVAFSWMLATPLIPASLSANAPTLSAAFAKQGADDPKNHDVNDDHGGKRKHKHGHGKDDLKNHDDNDDHGGKHKHGHGKDDPKNHDVGDDHGGKRK